MMMKEENLIMTSLIRNDLFEIASNFDASITCIDVKESDRHKNQYTIDLSLLLTNCYLIPKAQNQASLDMILQGKAEFTVTIHYYITNNQLQRDQQKSLDITDFEMNNVTIEHDEDFNDDEAKKFFENNYLVGVGEEFLLFTKDNHLVQVNQSSIAI